jgi:type IV pilus assembly protein PilX
MNTLHRFSVRANAPIRQRGAATLIMVMVLLVVITLIGLSGMRGTVMEERMSASTRDRGLAFQAAEAALRAGEDFVATKPPPTMPTTGCTNGLCGIPDPAATPVWDSASSTWNTARQITVTLGNQVVTPRYIIELMATNVPSQGGCIDISQGADCSGTERRYRITARSSGAGRAEVVLQSIYAVP